LTPLRPWWRGGVLYQIYLRSFADSDGDGVGDLAGVISRLDHLAWLGIDGIWLSPINPSPNADWGYDVADYVDVDPVYGDLATFDRLVAEAGERDIAVLVDLVPNHTSDRHAWFLEARGDPSAARRGWYVWADPGPDGSPPNNWTSVFGGPAWTLDQTSGQLYLHNFLREQPDLDWWNPAVRDAFDEILRFWLDRGAAGFRIDVAHGLIKDRELRDNPPATEDDPERVRRSGQRAVYNMNRPEVHDVFRRWRTLLDPYGPDRVLLGETFVLDLVAMASYYGDGGDELHLAFNFPFALAPLEAPALREIVARTEALMPADDWPAWTASNHDIGRFPTRWCAGEDDRVRCALMLLLTLRGTPVLYYGDEIGLVETDVTGDAVRDPVGKRWPERGRDRGRTPMHWRDGSGAGFTKPGVEPWLPLGDAASMNVESQRSDAASILHLCRDLIALRRRDRRLADGAYTELPSPPGTWVWKRAGGPTVALNLSDEEQEIGGLRGAIALSTRRDRDGERTPGALRLRGWEGAVVYSRLPKKTSA
jgi:alpha-glucosidase